MSSKGVMSGKKASNDPGLRVAGNIVGALYHKL